MTSKERVKRTFYFEPTDRMPIDYAGNIGINDKLMKHFKTDYNGVLDALNVDFRELVVPYSGRRLFEEINGLILNETYGFYAKWIEHSSGGYFDYSYFPLKDKGEDEIANYPLADPNDFDYSVIDEQIKRFKDRALFVGNAGYADFINTTGRVLGMEQTLINLFTEDEATLCYINRRCDMELKLLEKMIKRAKGNVDFVWIGEDLGTQIAPIISMDLYRKIIKPLHKKYIDLAKSYNLPVMVHTCGCSSWVYEDFIEMGVNAVDTLQPEVKNMSPQYLVEHFKGRLAFHGSISTGGALAFGTPREVALDVKEKCDIYRETRGYMISPTHQVQDNSPLENVLEMYKATLIYGKY